MRWSVLGHFHFVVICACFLLIYLCTSIYFIKNVYLGCKGALGFKPPSPSKIFYWPFKGGASFVDHLCYFCFVCFMHVCLLMPCDHLLGKGWPLGSRLWCLIVTLSLSRLYPWSGVVLDCIDSWYLPSFLLWHICFDVYRPVFFPIKSLKIMPCIITVCHRLGTGRFKSSSTPFASSSS